MLKTVGLIVLLGGLTSTLHAQMNPRYKFEEALKLIQKNYVDQIDDEQLVDAAIKAMLSELDPHSRYTSRKEAEDMRAAMSGTFAGIGIQFLRGNDGTYISSINPDGPAARSGLSVGDQIVSIDGKNIEKEKWGNKEVMLQLRGEKDQTVVLGIRKTENSELEQISIIRENILERSVRESYMVDSQIGYIALSVFNRTTRQEIDAALKKLLDQGMKKLILNLQSNGGGYVQSAIGVVDELLPNGKMVFYAQTNDGGKDYYYTGGSGRFYDGSLVVLIDESTASSSEIVTGALQDWDRAVIVGRRSFGKGLMQKPVALTDGSELQLTAARYYTPAGRSIQKSYKNGKEDYFKDFSRRMSSGELLEGGHVMLVDSLKVTTLTNKRTVYGGGGIMPDRFVPIDTNVYSTWMSSLMNSGIVARGCFDFVKQNRATLLKSFPDFATFNKKFKVPTPVHDQLVTFARSSKGLKLPMDSDIAAHAAIDVEIKGQIASLLYTDADYYTRVRNESDLSFLEACKILNDKKMYEALLHVSE